MRIIAIKNTASPDELIELCNNGSLNDLNAALQIAINKKYTSVIIAILRNTITWSHHGLPIVKTILSNISNNHLPDHELIIKEFLENSIMLNEESISNQLTAIASANSTIAAMIIMNKHTPVELTNSLFNKTNLARGRYVEHQSGQNHPIMNEIETLLEQGEKFYNKSSLFNILTRYSNNPQDVFSSHIAKYRLHPDILSLLKGEAAHGSSMEKSLVGNKTIEYMFSDINDNLTGNSDSNLRSIYGYVLDFITENETLVGYATDEQTQMLIRYLILQPDALYRLINTRLDRESITNFLAILDPQLSANFKPHTIPQLFPRSVRDEFDNAMRHIPETFNKIYELYLSGKLEENCDTSEMLSNIKNYMIENLLKKEDIDIDNPKQLKDIITTAINSLSTNKNQKMLDIARYAVHNGLFHKETLNLICALDNKSLINLGLSNEDLDFIVKSRTGAFVPISTLNKDNKKEEEMNITKNETGKTVDEDYYDEFNDEDFSIFSSDKNENKIIIEAGVVEKTFLSLVSALLLLMAGSTISNTAARLKLKEQDIINATNDHNLMSKAKELYSKPSIQKEVSNVVSGKNEKTKVNSTNTLYANIIARTIYAEAKRESSEGRKAVATAIYNRGKGNATKIISEIKRPLQFSCWNSATAKDWTNMKEGSGSVWDESLELANEIINGTFTPIADYNHYYNPDKVNRQPSWAYLDKAKTKLRPFTKIGNHHFLTL